MQSLWLGESLAQLRKQKGQRGCSERARLRQSCQRGESGPALPGPEPRQSPGRAQSSLRLGRGRLAGGPCSCKRQQPGTGCLFLGAGTSSRLRAKAAAGCSRGKRSRAGHSADWCHWPSGGGTGGEKGKRQPRAGAPAEDCYSSAGCPVAPGKG